MAEQTSSAAPSMASAAPITSNAATYPPGALPAQDAAWAKVSGQAQGIQATNSPQAPVAGPSAATVDKSERAVQSGQTLQSSGPENTPQWKDTNPGTPAQQAQQAGQQLHDAGVRDTSAPPAPATDNRSPSEQTQAAGQTMQNAGVTTDAAQSPETKAQMQNALDQASKNEQNSPARESVCDAAREEARQAPQQQEQEQSRSMSH